VLATSPGDGAVDVPRRMPLRIEVDRPLLPRTVSRATVRIESGVSRPFLSVRFDLVDQVIVATTFTTSPLEPSVVYRLTIEGVRDLDDRELPEPFSMAFRTGTEPGEPLAPRGAAWADVEPIFERSCADTACHGPGAAVLGLDLSSAEAVRNTAIGRPSLQFPSATSSSEGSGGTLALAGLRIIDVLAGSGRPELSYLLYKMIGDPHALGEPMPPPGDRDHPPLTDEELRLVADWILAGAPTD
jgi:hypothetical protein